MANLNEISTTHLQMLERETWDNKLTCALTNKQLTMLTNEMSGALNWYSFTLVTEGHIILDNGGANGTRHSSISQPDQSVDNSHF